MICLTCRGPIPADAHQALGGEREGYCSSACAFTTVSVTVPHEDAQHIRALINALLVLNGYSERAIVGPIPFAEDATTTTTSEVGE